MRDSRIVTCPTGRLAKSEFAATRLLDVGPATIHLVCKGVPVCTELGTDPTQWSATSPLWPKGWFPKATQSFREAYRVGEAGDLERALAHLADTRGPELRDWYDVHAQNSGNFRVAHFGREPKPKSGLELDALRDPKRFEGELFERDGFRCRYCGTDVFSTAMLKRFERMVGLHNFRATGTNATRHGVAMAFRAVLDHVEPYNRGGRTDPSNLVTSCWPCNYGKAEYTLPELGLRDPRAV